MSAGITDFFGSSQSDSNSLDQVKIILVMQDVWGLSADSDATLLCIWDLFHVICIIFKY